MINTTTKDYIIELLRSAVKDTTPNNPPDDLNMEDLFLYARKHRILHVVFYALNKLPFSVVSNIPQWNTYIMSYKMQLVDDANRSNETALIHTLLSNHSIPHIFLKGSVTRYMYPDTVLRIMSDIDILYKGIGEKELIKLVVNSGFDYVSHSYKEVVFNKPAINIKLEFQKQLMDAGYPKWNAYLSKVWSKSKEASGSSYTMPSDMFLIYHIIHMAKHFINGGIGFNHICDLYLIRNTYTDIKPKKLRKALKKLDLLDFYNAFVRVCDKWFDEKALSPQDEGTVNILENYILKSGAFGNTKQQAVNELVLAGDTKTSLRRKLFPSKRKLANYYGDKIFKFPVVIPFYWIKLTFTRIFRFDNKKRANDVHTISVRQINATADLFGRLGLK